MSERQAEYLRVLCTQHGETFDPSADKDTASEWIARLAGPRRQLTRADVRTVACPRCGAETDELCRGANGPRVANHVERVAAARGVAGDAYRGGNQPGGHVEGRDPFSRDRMTAPQEKFLRSLCDRHGEVFDPGLSRADASALIGSLVARGEAADANGPVDEW